MRRSSGGRLRPSRSSCVLEGLTQALELIINGAATMQLAMIGLGRMGGNMVRRLVQGGHELIVYDSSAEEIKSHVGTGAKGAKDVADVARQLAPRRVVWIMVQSSAPSSSSRRISPGETSPSTVATRTSATRCGAPKRSRNGESSSWMSGRA